MKSNSREIFILNPAEKPNYPMLIAIASRLFCNEANIPHGKQLKRDAPLKQSSCKQKDMYSGYFSYGLP